MNFNPYQQIDERRKQIDAMGDFGPSFQLPNQIGPVWNDIKKMCAGAFVSKMQTGGKPPAPHIYAFNIMSQGDRPFTNEQFATLCTEVGLLYSAELKKNNAQSHNANVANQIAIGMVDLFCLAVVKGDQNLQNMCPPSERQNVMNAASEYEGRVNQAHQIISGGNGGWGNSNSNGGWGSNDNNNGSWGAGSNNGGWGSNENNGWGDQSWGSAAHEDITSSNTSGWDEGSHDESGWGNGNEYSLSNSWGDDDAPTTTGSDSGWGSKEKVKPDVMLDETEQAIAALMGQGEEESQAEDNTADEESTSGGTSFEDLGFDSDEINWVGNDDDIMDWGSTEEESDDEDCPSIEELQEMDEQLPAVELNDFFINGYTLHPETMELRDFTITNEDDYLAKVHAEYGDVKGLIIPNKEGKHLVGIHETTVANDQQRFLNEYDPMLGLGITLPINSMVPIYIVNEDMELVRKMIRLEDHDIYNVEEEVLDEIIGLVEAAQPNTPSLHDTLKGKVEWMELGTCSSLSELYANTVENCEKSEVEAKVVIGEFSNVTHHLNMPVEWKFNEVFTSLEDVIAFIKENDEDYPRLTRSIERTYLNAYNNLVRRVSPEDDFTANNLETVLDVIGLLTSGDLSDAGIGITNTRATQLRNLIYSLARDLFIRDINSNYDDQSDTRRIVTGVNMSGIIVIDDSIKVLEELCGELSSGSYRLMTDSIPEGILSRLQLDKLNGVVITPDYSMRLTRINDDWVQLTIMETIS